MNIFTGNVLFSFENANITFFCYIDEKNELLELSITFSNTIFKLICI